MRKNKILFIYFIICIDKQYYTTYNIVTEKQHASNQILKGAIIIIFQLGSALLDACVLAILKKEDVYGYILTQNIKRVVDVSESTLYPVLRRLQKDDYLTTYDQPFNGRNRRYYKISDSGKCKLDEYIHEWENYKQSVDKILLEGDIINE